VLRALARHFGLRHLYDLKASARPDLQFLP